MNHTPNYNLSQWDAEDKVLRTDFNADNAKIDAALSGLASGRADSPERCSSAPIRVGPITPAPTASAWAVWRFQGRRWWEAEKQPCKS